jgi:hypothetical protein
MSEDAYKDRPAQYICAVLKQLAITQCTMQFDGGSDTGQLSDIELTGLHTEPEFVPFTPELVTVTLDGKRVCFNPFQHDRRPPTLKDWLRQWFYDVGTDLVEYDWCNNDGGGGMITILPEKGTVTLEGYYYEQVSNDVFSQWDSEES